MTATALFQRVLEVSLGTGLVIAALLLLRPLLKRRYPARLLCWVWVVLAVRLLLPAGPEPPRHEAAVRVPEPALRVELPVGPGPAAEAPAAGPAVAASGRVPAEVPPGPVVRSAARPAVTLDGWTVVAAVWLAGCGVWAVLGFGPCAAFRRKVRRWSAPETDPAVLARFEALREELGAKHVRLLRCRAAGTPMAMGLFRPVLLLPEADYGPAALDAVFRHELSHIRRKHLWCKLLLLLCRTVHWFNPLVWLMACRAEGDLELACDEAAVRGMDRAGRADYGRAVLDAVEADGRPRAPLTTCFRGGKGPMLERLKALLDTSAKQRGAAVLVLAVASAVACAGLFSVEREGPERALDAGAYRMDLPQGVSWSYDGPKDVPVPAVRLYRDGEEAGRVAYLPMAELPQELVPPLAFHSEDLETLPNGMWGLMEEDGNVYALVGFEVLHLYFGPALTGEERTAMLTSLRVGAVVSETAEGRMVTHFDSGAGDQDRGWLCLWDAGGWQSGSGASALFPEEPVEFVGPTPWSPDGSRVAVTLRSPEMTTFNIEPIQEATDFQLLRMEEKPLDTPFTASGWDLGYKLAEEPRAEFVPIAWSADGQSLQFSYAWDDAEGVRRTGTAWYWPDVETAGVHFISGAATQGAPRLELGQAVYRGSPGYLSAEVCNDSEGTISFSSSALLVERWNGERWLVVRHPWDGPPAADYAAGPGERRDMGWQLGALDGGLYRVGLDYTDTKTGGTGRMSAAFLVQGRSVWWSEPFDGCTVSLEDWDGVLRLVLERNGELTVLKTPGYGAEHPYFSHIRAEPFTNVMGRDGFILTVPVGSASTSIAYYALDETGAPLCIGQCENTAYELDLDGDGTGELLTNYGTMGRALVYAWVDGGPKVADVNAVLDRRLGLEPLEAGAVYQGLEYGKMVFRVRRNDAEGADLGEMRVGFEELTFTTFEQPEPGPVG